MEFINIKRIIVGIIIFQLSISGLALGSAAAPFVSADNDKRTPILPSPLCDSIQVEAGNKVSSHTYAIGVQIYRWNGAAWDFVAPEANLYADAGYRGKVGTHYEGPTWESNSGSTVKAERVPNTGCPPDPTAIPWLLLRKVSAEGPGIYSRVTFIQRVNTVGGLKPTTPGSFVGEEKRVPYTAEYYFYRAQD